MNPRFNIASVVIAAVVALFGFALAFWGWKVSPEYYSTGKAAYLAVQIFVLSDAYDAVKVDSPWQLHVARWLGVVVFSWAVVSAVVRGFGRSWRRYWARRKRKHVIVIGAVPFADALSDRAIAAKKKELACIQLRSPSDPEFSKGRLIRLPYNGLHSLEEAGLAGARKIVIAANTDAEAIDLALAVQSRCKDRNDIDIVTRLNDIGLGRSLNAVPGGEKLRIFSEAGAAAREVIRRHPPYLIAKDLGQKRIQALLVGDHGWVEAIMVEIILSACTLRYGKPVFKIFTRNSADFSLRLATRYPELSETADFTVSDANNTSDDPIEESQLESISRDGLVTCTYCAFDDGAHSLAAAAALRKQALRLEELKAPIFVRLSGDIGLPRPDAGSELGEDALVPFGSMKDIIKATGILSPSAEKAEQDWHNAYLAMIPKHDKGKAANRPWEELDEEYRIANRRAVAHIYAKLFEAGFDLRPWLAWANVWEELPCLARGEILFRDEMERARLAELEHVRWNAERRTQGWVYGPVRLNPRKIHDCLVPFSDLPPKIQSHDYEFIEDLGAKLRNVERGIKRNN